MIPVNKLILNKSDARAVYNSINKKLDFISGTPRKKIREKICSNN